MAYDALDGASLSDWPRGDSGLFGARAPRRPREGANVNPPQSGQAPGPSPWYMGADHWYSRNIGGQHIRDNAARAILADFGDARPGASLRRMVLVGWLVTAVLVSSCLTMVAFAALERQHVKPAAAVQVELPVWQGTAAWR